MSGSNFSLSNVHAPSTATSLTGPDESCSAAAGQPLRQFIKDLPLPPELAQEVEDLCRRRGYHREADRRRVEEEVKLQYHFGGRDVAYLTTPEGLLVVAVGDLRSIAFGRALEALSGDERRQVTLYSPDRWNDPTTTLLTPSADEA